MTAHLPVLIVVIPLVAAIVTPLLARLSSRWSRALTIGALTAAHVCSLAALSRVLATGNVALPHGRLETHRGGSST